MTLPRRVREFAGPIIAQQPQHQPDQQRQRSRDAGRQQQPTPARHALIIAKHLGQTTRPTA
jgi:hypothetical protein